MCRQEKSRAGSGQPSHSETPPVDWKDNIFSVRCIIIFTFVVRKGKCRLSRTAASKMHRGNHAQCVH